MYRQMLQFALVLSLFACLISLPASGWAAPAPKRFQLRVSLYPWIPNPTSFFQWIEADFEAKYPDIDLVVRSLQKSFGLADLAYEPDQTAAALTDERNPDFQHLVELYRFSMRTSHSLAERRSANSGSRSGSGVPKADSGGAVYRAALTTASGKSAGSGRANL